MQEDNKVWNTELAKENLMQYFSIDWIIRLGREISCDSHQGPSLGASLC